MPIGSTPQPVGGQETTTPSSTQSTGPDMEQDAHSESQTTKTNDPGILTHCYCNKVNLAV